MTATLRLKTEQLSKIRRWVGLTTDASLATRMGIDAGNLSRVLRGLQQPGPRFIAGLCLALGEPMHKLFVVEDKEAA